MKKTTPTPSDIEKELSKRGMTMKDLGAIGGFSNMTLHRIKKGIRRLTSLEWIGLRDGIFNINDYKEKQ